MYFTLLRVRLLTVVKTRVRNGELTERRLARLIGISQPHIHNVLNGHRILSPKIADDIIRTLEIKLADLLRPGDLLWPPEPYSGEPGTPREERQRRALSANGEDR